MNIGLVKELDDIVHCDFLHTSSQFTGGQSPKKHNPSKHWAFAMLSVERTKANSVVLSFMMLDAEIT